MIILIDFDGTCVSHDFPRVGKDIGAAPVLRELVANGHQLILFTMRGHGGGDMTGVCEESPDIKPGDFLTDAINWFEENKIPLFGINTHPTQKEWTSSPKAYGHMMIDDTALGVPLIYPHKVEDNKLIALRPCVDWMEVRILLIKRGLIKQ